VRERTRELEEAYERIKGLSITDPLTGAFNRRYLDMEIVREIERAVRYGLPLSLLFCDLDRFKAINDRFGHGTGDEVLRAFSRIVFAAIRGNIDWFARYGGEEFIVVVPGTRSEDAAILAERLRAQAEAEALESESGIVSFTLSVGVAELEAGARALAQRQPGRVSSGPVLLAGFSLGAILASRLAVAAPARFPRLYLVEGGQQVWTPATLASFARGGGKALVLGCGSKGCGVWARQVCAEATRRGLGCAAVVAPQLGHSYTAPLPSLAREPWRRLLAPALE